MVFHKHVFLRVRYRNSKKPIYEITQIKLNSSALETVKDLLHNFFDKPK